jgi:hypothetical protein
MILAVVAMGSLLFFLFKYNVSYNAEPWAAGGWNPDYSSVKTGPHELGTEVNFHLVERAAAEWPFTRQLAQR